MVEILDEVRLPYTAKVAANGTGIVSSDRVKSGQVLVCRSIAWRNQTGTRGTASILIRQGSVTFALGDQTSPTAGQWYYYPYKQLVNEGEQVEISQASCLANDILDLVLIGYIEYKKDYKR